MNEQDKKITLLLEDLAALESYVHDLFTFSPLPICFISPLGVILEANPAFLKISNFDFSEIIGETIEKLFDKQAIKKLASDTLKKGAVESKEAEFFPKDKKSLLCQVFTKTRKDEKGKAVGYFLGLFDLTRLGKREQELKSAQNALLNILEDTEEARWKAEEEKNKTEAIITSFTDGLLVFDKDNRLTRFNPQAENFLKIKPDKIVGKTNLELSGVDELQGLMKILGKEMKGIFRKELELRENFILEVSTIPLITAGYMGEPRLWREKEKIGTLVILHDISREKIVERLKTEFVSISAHQLRTPLSAIKWTLRMLLDGDLGEITPEQMEYLQRTYRSNERMIALINSLLNVTRIEEGRFLYRPAPAKIDEIVETVVGTFVDEAKKRQLELKFEKDEKLPVVLIDTEKIKLAIYNLIDNAVRYTLPGGRVKIFLKRINMEIEFQVQDTGVGIPKEQQERVFSKFFRGANVMRLETEGTGLGLFITKNIIEAHGGKIWFESEKGKGTTFHFTLPVGKEFEEFLEKL